MEGVGLGSFGRGFVDLDQGVFGRVNLVFHLS
jgi:hypothetical protein